MKNHINSTSSAEQTAAASAGQQQQSTPGTGQLASPEQLLRRDAAQIPVPPAIAQRLALSAAQLPPPKAAWWHRFWGGAGR